MIINIRGTNGSGKSTVVREVMRRCAAVIPAYKPGADRPYGYIGCQQRTPESWPDPIFIVGHYGTACGGADTYPSIDAVYAAVHRERRYHVLYEGMLVQDDVRRAVELKDEVGVDDLLVIALDVPIEQCLESIRARRAEAGNGTPVNPENTVSRAERLKRTMVRLKEGGVQAEWHTRESALQRCIAAFGLPQEPYDRPVDAFQLA